MEAATVCPTVAHSREFVNRQAVRTEWGRGFRPAAELLLGVYGPGRESLFRSLVGSGYAGSESGQEISAQLVQKVRPVQSVSLFRDKAGIADHAAEFLFCSLMVRPGG